MSSSNGLFLDIGLEELSLPGAGLSVDNVETEASSSAGTSFGVDFVAAWYCAMGLGASVPFWDSWSEELALLSSAFETEVFFILVGIAFGSSIATFFVSSLVLSNGDTLTDDVCDSETGSAALSFDTCRESGASSEVDSDAMFSLDTGFKIRPLFDLGGSKKLI